MKMLEIYIDTVKANVTPFRKTFKKYQVKVLVHADKEKYFKMFQK